MPDDPIEDDIRHDEEEFDPTIEPKSAKAWLNLLEEAEDAFEDWNSCCDRIELRYASLTRLNDKWRDREFQMFWANMEVIKPSIYAKPPVPAVSQKFKDRRPVTQAAAEFLERCLTVTFDIGGIDELMKLIRDDLGITDRGVAWLRYESGNDGSYYDHEKVCFDFKNRRDFLHSISRNWREVTWVAGASYMTRKEARKRFYKSSGDEYQRADYKIDKESQEVGGADRRQRAKFWEIWSKDDRRVVWVAEGCDKILDEADPHLDLRQFFPCPKPAYGTVQRGSLVPVPDVLQYQDQLDEINMLTGRIHALSDAVEAKGFYPSGASEIAEAVKTAVTMKSPGEILVPVANWAAFGGTKDVIIWLPIAEISQTIINLVTLRKQVIEDIYQITGLSDIMRGETDPQETLGAQELKSQYGSTRIRDKQQELVRLARDMVEIASEIITEKFDPVTMVEMSQTQLPTQQMQERQVNQIVSAAQAQIQQALANPQIAQQAQQNPQMAQQLMQQLQQQTQAQVNKIQQQANLDQVLHLLKDDRTKCFVLDIETDSTIMADENAEKQRRTEFVGMLGTLLPQLGQLVTADPKAAELCGQLLKFSVAPYRAGRQLDGVIDEYIEQKKAMADQPQQDNPAMAANKTQIQIEQMKQETAKQKNAQDLQIKQQELEQKDRHKQMDLQNDKDIEQMRLDAKQQDNQTKAVVQGQKMQENREAHQAHMIELGQKMTLDREKAAQAAQANQAKQQALREGSQRAAQQHQMKMQQPPGGNGGVP